VLRHVDLRPRNRHLGAGNRLQRFRVRDVPGDRGFSVRAGSISARAADQRQRRWYGESDDAGAVGADAKRLGDEHDAEGVQAGVKYDDAISPGSEAVDLELSERVG